MKTRTRGQVFVTQSGSRERKNQQQKQRQEARKRNERRASYAMGAAECFDFSGQTRRGRDDITPLQTIIPMVQTRFYSYKLCLRQWYGRGLYFVESYSRVSLMVFLCSMHSLAQAFEPASACSLGAHSPRREAFRQHQKEPRFSMGR